MQRRNATAAISLSWLLLFSLISMTAMAEPATIVPSSSEAKSYIVFTEEPLGEEPEAHHIRTLTAVLGSEVAAKEALIYTYSHAITGFAAKLTPEQAAILSKQPGVLQVMPSRQYHLDSGSGKLQI